MTDASDVDMRRFHFRCFAGEFSAERAGAGRNSAAKRPRLASYRDCGALYHVPRMLYTMQLQPVLILVTFGRNIGTIKHKLIALSLYL